jgi:hypothetical protein
VTQQNPLKKERRARNFSGAFMVTATLMPVTATLFTLAVYFAISQFSYSRLTSIAGGAVLALVFWLVMAVFYSPRTTAERSDRYRYRLLLSWSGQQKQQLQIIKNEFATYESQTTSYWDPKMKEIRFLLADVEAAIADFYDSLNEVRPGADWALGTGYVELSRNVHKVDEALIMLLPLNNVIEFGSFLKAEVANSEMSDLEQKLRSLEKALDYLISDLDDQVVQKKSVKKSAMEVKSQGEARGTIRGVSRSLHEFDDDQWMRQVNLLIALNRLTLLTGLALYILLIFAILIGIPLSILISVTFFALIGACTGILGRLYEQAKTDIPVDSTPLANARLMAVPVLSGLAAIGGVALLQKVAATSSDFSFILTPFNILAAAAFGLVPSLFFSALLRQAGATDKGKLT